MSMPQILRAVALASPDGVAIVEEDRSLTYRAFDDQVSRLAGSLMQRAGSARGDRIGIWMENCLEFLPVLYGIWRAGMVAVPINNKLHPKELAWILENAGARLCIVSPDLAGKLSDLPSDTALPEIIITGTSAYAGLLTGAASSAEPPRPEDAAWLFYTSGTTGRPKGAVLTHRNLLFMTHAYYADIDFLSADDTILHAAPMSHGSGLYGLAFVSKGATNVIVPGSFEPERIYAAIANYTSVSMFAAPTMVSRLINHPLAGTVDTRNLKTIIYGGAAMYVADLKRALSLYGPKLYQVYGQGESPMTITGLSRACHADAGHPRFDARLGSAGYPRTGCAVRVVDEAGRDVPAGEVGEIITQSDCVMDGYWKNPDANAKSLRDGWLWTGDLGSLDADGLLSIKDRSKDMIISGGSNIYPREIEEVLLTHAVVLECAVVSKPHPDWGEEVIAFVVPRPGARVEAADLDRLCLDNIARFKRPKGYRIVAALPKNLSLIHI